MASDHIEPARKRQLLTALAVEFSAAQSILSFRAGAILTEFAMSRGSGFFNHGTKAVLADLPSYDETRKVPTRSASGMNVFLPAWAGVELVALSRVLLAEVNSRVYHPVVATAEEISALYTALHDDLAPLTREFLTELATEFSRGQGRCTPQIRRLLAQFALTRLDFHNLPWIEGLLARLTVECDKSRINLGPEVLYYLSAIVPECSTQIMQMLTALVLELEKTHGGITDVVAYQLTQLIRVDCHGPVDSTVHMLLSELEYFVSDERMWVVVSPWADAIALKAMAKSPTDMYQQAADMRADLQRAVAGLSVPGPRLSPRATTQRTETASRPVNGKKGAGKRGLLRLAQPKQEPEAPITKVIRHQPVRQARSKRTGKR